MMNARYRLGFDIGGTFTDFVLEDVSTGRIATHKCLTTPRDPSLGALAGIRELLAGLGLSGSDLATAIHGTTLIANALIERKGASTALITTCGFRDVVEMGKEMRYDIYDLRMPMPEPLVPRPWRLEVDERMDSAGRAVRPLATQEVEALVQRLQAGGIEAVAICLLHSFRNPAHERAIAAILADHLPQVSLSLSSEVAPEIREYERTSTTICNAYVQPLAEHYLRELTRRLREEGYRHTFFLMLSSGGIVAAETAARYPIRLTESGPAAGAVAGTFYGELAGHRDVISFDMGGTTAKICLIKDGTPTKTTLLEVARVQRFRRGSGLPLRIPALEMIEIGAGGGSIARIDELGLLKVGPHSAGADPGPACYGFGGTDPTVTDADLILGYLDPDYFLGGRMRLDRDAAARAITEKIARPLGLDLVTAAHGIFHVVNEQMIAATRVHVAERGEDPRRFALVAFGGAGPIHAGEIARALKIGRVVIPAGAGVASALGFLVATPAFDFARSFVAPLERADLRTLHRLHAGMEEEGRAMLRLAGVPDASMRFVRSADMRHRGQGHEITVTLPVTSPRMSPEDLEGAAGEEARGEIRRAFFETYRRLYGHIHEDVEVEILTCRLLAMGVAPQVVLDRAEEGKGHADVARKGQRLAFFVEEGGFVECPVYGRAALPAGALLRGPAIVEEEGSTTVIGPHMVARVDPYRTLVVDLE